MFEKIFDIFLGQPRRMTNLGEVMINLGYWLGVAGLIGAVATKAVGVVHSLTPQSSVTSAPTLAEIYPALPTGWVPESIAGLLITLTIFMLGIWLKRTGRQIERLVGY